MGMYGTYYSDICNKKSCVYWLYDADGELLYVGLTTNPLGRISQHRSRQPWGKEIDDYEVEWFPNRETAKSAERAAIHYDNPLHNVVRPAVV
jgi:predicted GIY-YIG superfamily endonuclease